MKLTELLLNRFLYKDNQQSLETRDSTLQSLDSSDVEPTPISSGGAAQDINTGNVTVSPAQLTPGVPLPPGLLDVANWGWSQTCSFSSTDLDTVSWGSGTFKSSSGTSYSISAGNTGNMSAKTYIYLDLNVSSTVYQKTTTPATAVGLGKVLVAIAQNAASSATFNLNEASQIVGDNILANTINATKMNVGQLSAITADLGTITAGTITGALIQTSSSGHRVVIDGASDDIIFYNSNGDETIFLDGAGTAAAYSQVSIGGGIRLSNDINWDYTYYSEIYSGAGDTTNFVIHPIGFEDYYFFFTSKGEMQASKVTVTSVSADTVSGTSDLTLEALGDDVIITAADDIRLNGDIRVNGTLGVNADVTFLDGDGVTVWGLSFDGGILVDLSVL